MQLLRYPRSEIAGLFLSWTRWPEETGDIGLAAWHRACHRVPETTLSDMGLHPVKRTYNSNGVLFIHPGPGEWLGGQSHR